MGRGRSPADATYQFIEWQTWLEFNSILLFLSIDSYHQSQPFESFGSKISIIGEVVILFGLAFHIY